MRAVAWLCARLTLGVVLFQIAFAVGAPWGHLTMGGRFLGRLPPGLRLAVLGPAALLGLFAVVVLGQAGAGAPAPPRGLFLFVIDVTGLVAALNRATPSIPERRLWGPITLLMLACVIWVTIGRPGRRKNRFDRSSILRLQTLRYGP